jgi:hypothetical protein
VWGAIAGLASSDQSVDSRSVAKNIAAFDNKMFDDDDDNKKTISFSFGDEKMLQIFSVPSDDDNKTGAELLVRALKLSTRLPVTITTEDFMAYVFEDYFVLLLQLLWDLPLDYQAATIFRPLLELHSQRPTHK